MDISSAARSSYPKQKILRTLFTWPHIPSLPYGNPASIPPKTWQHPRAKVKILGIPSRSYDRYLGNTSWNWRYLICAPCYSKAEELCTMKPKLRRKCEQTPPLPYRSITTNDRLRPEEAFCFCFAWCHFLLHLSFFFFLTWRPDAKWNEGGALLSHLHSHRSKTK